MVCVMPFISAVTGMVTSMRSPYSSSIAVRKTEMSIIVQSPRHSSEAIQLILIIEHDAVNLLRDKGYLVSGDLVVVTQGDVMSTIGSTNTTRILTVE